MLFNPNNESYKSTRITVTGIVVTADTAGIRAGMLGGYLVASGSPVVTVYDGQSTGGTILQNAMQTVAGTPYPLPAQFNNGVYVVMTGAGDITFFYW